LLKCSFFIVVVFGQLTVHSAVYTMLAVEKQNWGYTCIAFDEFCIINIL